VSQFPAISGIELVRALGTLGFQVIRVKGSHHFMRHPDGRTTVVPVHGREDIGPGLLSKILRDIVITREELRDQL